MWLLLLLCVVFVEMMKPFLAERVCERWNCSTGRASTLFVLFPLEQVNKHVILLSTGSGVKRKEKNSTVTTKKEEHRRSNSKIKFKKQTVTNIFCFLDRPDRSIATTIVVAVLFCFLFFVQSIHPCCKFYIPILIQLKVCFSFFYQFVGTEKNEGQR